MHGIAPSIFPSLDSSFFITTMSSISFFQQGTVAADVSIGLFTTLHDRDILYFISSSQFTITLTLAGSYFRGSLSIDEEILAVVPLPHTVLR